MMPEDLEHPLLDDECARCAQPWPECICDPRRPYRQPTPEEIEAARRRRLAQAERESGGEP